MFPRGYTSLSLYPLGNNDKSDLPDLSELWK